MAIMVYNVTIVNHFKRIIVLILSRLVSDRVLSSRS